MMTFYFCVKIPIHFKRDEARRANHNEIERKRRNKINNGIFELGKIIPENFYPDNSSKSSSSSSKPSTVENLSKGGVLYSAYKYINHLKSLNSELQFELNSVTSNSDHKKLTEIERLSQLNGELLLENAQLKRKLGKDELVEDKIYRRKSSEEGS